LSGGGEELQEWVQQRFAARPHGLAHALLAARPSREAATTNWAALFEQAVADTGQRLAVLPYDDPDDADRWLLKLHGDARRRTGIVVRRHDYLRFASEQSALAGIVQSLMFTRHMLFVGFSLVDDNFIRIADDVTRIVDRYAGRERDRATLGTTVGLHDDPARRALWPHLDHVLVADGDMDTAERAHLLEVFLDLVCRPPGPRAQLPARRALRRPAGRRRSQAGRAPGGNRGGRGLVTPQPGHPGRDMNHAIWHHGGSRRGTSAASRTLDLLAGKRRSPLQRLNQRQPVTTTYCPGGHEQP
jgi:hypothetical protein